VTVIAAVLIAFIQDDGLPRRVQIDNVDAWPKSGRIVVEGVFTSMSEQSGSESRRMHLRPPKRVPFNVPFNVPRSLLIQKDAPVGNIDVTGVVEILGGKTVVQVEDYRLLPGDQARFDEKLSEAGDDATKLLAAATWANRRFKLYGSESMREAAAKATSAALQAERKSAGGDPARLSALKIRLLKDRQFDVDMDVLEHEIRLAELAQIPEGDHAALAAFAERVRDTLPGAKDIGDAVDPRYRRDYDVKPLPTYEKAEAALRRALARYFYSTLVAKSLDLRFEKNGDAPFDLAQSAKQLAPEYREIARKWFRQWVKTQEGRLHALEADAAVDAARLIETELEEFPRARRFREDWLDAREAAVRKRESDAAVEAGSSARVQRDADAWFELANLRLKWFPDDSSQVAKSVRILEDVLSFAPRHSKSEVELRRLGYTSDGTGRWKPKMDRGAEGRRSPAAKPLAVNMTTAEVLDALGKPTHRSRVVTAAGVSVVWIYRANGRDTLVMFSGPPESLRVSRINTPDQ
jgi:hypothetical protein